MQGNEAKKVKEENGRGRIARAKDYGKRLVTRLKNMGLSAANLLRWTAVALCIGVIAGIIGALFDRAVGGCDRLFAAYDWLIWLLPAFGLLITWLFRRLDVADLSTDSVIRTAGDGTRITLRLVPAIFAGTVLTHLGGGSSGREGAAFQMGGTIGSQIGHLFRMDKGPGGHGTDGTGVRICIMTGMAAFFAAVFGLPVTAALFVTMVISVGSFWHVAVFPELVASLCAAAVSGTLGVQPLRIAVRGPEASVSVFLKVALLAALGGILSSIFCDALHLTGRALKKLLPNGYLRIFVTGAVVAALIFCSGTAKYSGGGTTLIRLAVGDGQAAWYDFIVKLALTCLTLGAGYKGGEVFPSFAIGACFGCTVAPLIGLPAEFGAAVGLVTVFGGASNSLIAPIFLAIEMFGIHGLNYYALACVISYILSGYAGFYSNQKIVYSKIIPRQINRNANEHLKE